MLCHVISTGELAALSDAELTGKAAALADAIAARDESLPDEVRPSVHARRADRAFVLPSALARRVE